VVSGIGAAAYGVNALGQQASAGGWGYIIGDEGGGYWIALRALNACCRADDGIAAPTQILPLLLQHLELADIQEICHCIYACNPSRRDVAAMSEVVGRAAVAGDATARRILREAGKELALIVNACIVRLGLDQGAVTIGTVGGVFRAGRFVLRSFREAVKRVAPAASIVPCAVPPAVGAVLIALEDIDLPIADGVLTNVQATLPRLGPLKM
jgi:N-acetylglucosamine kinase